eukprot:628215-Rhodomonas_salina.2
MQEELTKQEELVERLRKQLPAAHEEQTCHVSDQECRRQEKRSRRRKVTFVLESRVVLCLLKGECCRAQGRKAEEQAEEPPSERFKFSKKLELPSKIKLAVTEWLPFPDANEPQKMSSMLVSGDLKGTLHFFSSDGSLIVSHPTGYTSAITAMAVHKVHESECVVVVANEKGAIRSFSVTRPPRFTLVMEKKQNKKKGPPAWVPIIRQVADFSPSTAPQLEGIRVEKAFTHDMSTLGAKSITVVEVIPKGKSYNILAADGEGRVSFHLRNGSAIGALRLSEEKPGTP